MEHFKINKDKGKEDIEKQADALEVELRNVLVQWKGEYIPEASFKEKAVEVVKKSVLFLADRAVTLSDILFEAGLVNKALPILSLIEDLFTSIGEVEEEQKTEAYLRLKQNFTSVVIRNISQLDPSTLSPANKFNSLVLYEILYDNSYSTGKSLVGKKVLSIIPEVIRLVKANPGVAKDFFINLHRLRKMAGYRGGIEYELEDGLIEILKLLSERDKDVDGETIAILLTDGNLIIRDSGMKILNKKLAATGLDIQDLRTWWARGHQGDPIEFIKNNIEAIEKLEVSKPGITKFLNTQYGVRDFSRYPQEVLIRIYEQREEKTVPYGLIIFPKDDWNGAFNHKQKIFKDLAQQLQQFGYSLRIIECESKRDLARRIIKVNKLYGQASFAIVGGHGTENSIAFGNFYSDNLNSKLSKEDLLGRGVGRGSKFFIPNPSIILSSCSTGKNEGIGQRLSEVYNARVIAPDIPTSIHKISVVKDAATDSLVFEVGYYKKESGRSFTAGRPE